MLFIHAKIRNIFRYETLKNLNEKKRKLMEMLSDDVKTYFEYKKKKGRKKERKKGVVVFKVHLECY